MFPTLMPETSFPMKKFISMVLVRSQTKFLKYIHHFFDKFHVIRIERITFIIVIIRATCCKTMQSTITTGLDIHFFRTGMILLVHCRYQHLQAHGILSLLQFLDTGPAHLGRLDDQTGSGGDDTFPQGEFFMLPVQAPVILHQLQLAAAGGNGVAAHPVISQDLRHAVTIGHIPQDPQP